MYTSGFTLIYRDEEQDWLYQDTKRFGWWLWLRSHATPKPCIQSVGMTRKVVRLQYGELAATYSFLSRAWDADERAIDGFLKLMAEDGRISMRDEKGVLIIKINNYERFSPPAGYFAKKTRNEMSTEMPTEMQVDMEFGNQSEMYDEMADEVRDQEPISRKIRKTQKGENFSTDLSARERSFFESLKESDMTLEQIQYSLKPQNGREEILQLLEQFINHCLSVEEYHSELKSFKQHFVNWARIQIRENLKVNSKKNQNGQIEKKGVAAGATRRRGTEGSARTAADYEKPFSTQPDNNDD